MSKRVILRSLEGKNGNTFVKLNTGDYKSAVKSMIITFNDGKQVEVTDQSTFFPRDPREFQNKMHELGYIDEETLNKRLAAVEKLHSELTIEVE